MPDNVVYIPSRLYSRLKSIYHNKLTVVCAPENYGKSTILHSFLERSRAAGMSVRFVTGCSSANECFSRWCRLAIGEKQEIPVTEADYCILYSKFRDAEAAKPTVIVLDCEAAAELIVNLHSMRLMQSHSPVSTVIVCESLSELNAVFMNAKKLNLVTADELRLTADETAEYFTRRGISDEHSALVHRNTGGEIMRTRLCADLLKNGIVPQDFSPRQLIVSTIVPSFPITAKLAALFVCAFERIDEKVSGDLLSEPALTEFYGRELLTLEAINNGIKILNQSLPNFWINSSREKYSPPQFAREAVFESFTRLPQDVRNAICRCCAKYYIRRSKNFTAFCLYCIAGEYQTAAELPSQGGIQFDYILRHKETIYNIVKNAPLDCKPLLPRIIRLLALMMLTEYKEELRGRFGEITAYITTSPDYTEKERRGLFCYANALRIYEEFPAADKMGVHVKRAYEYFSGVSEYPAPLYSWSLYTPSVFALLHRYDIAASTQFDQFTRYHRMYAEMMRHGEFMEQLYIAENHYYMGNLRKSMELSRDIAEQCRTPRLAPSRLIAQKNAARCALLCGDYTGYNAAVKDISAISKRYSTTEIGGMALLVMAMLCCTKLGDDGDMWYIVASEEASSDYNRYAAPFHHYVRCCFLLKRGLYDELLRKSPEYIRAAQSVRNQTMELMMKLTAATAKLMTDDSKGAMALLSEVIDALKPSGIITPAVEHCMGYPELFRHGEAALGESRALFCRRILQASAPLRTNVEALRSIELTKLYAIKNRETAASFFKDNQKLALRKKLGLTETAMKYALLAADGKTNEEIAALMNVTENSVKSSLKRTFARLGVKNRAKLKAMLSNL